MKQYAVYLCERCLHPPSVSPSGHKHPVRADSASSTSTSESGARSLGALGTTPGGIRLRARCDVVRHPPHRTAWTHGCWGRQETATTTHCPATRAPVHAHPGAEVGADTGQYCATIQYSPTKTAHLGGSVVLYSSDTTAGCSISTTD